MPLAELDVHVIVKSRSVMQGTMYLLPEVSWLALFRRLVRIMLLYRDLI